jgi:NAD(P)-dependent dehydrogenase (short-subunit alcohol dehydrogenase family)
MKLTGSTFLVTGAASGLGAGTARRFANAGANVVLTDLNEDAGASLANEIGSKARFLKADVTNETEVQAAVDTAWKEFSSLNGAINCAGILMPAKVIGKDGSPHKLDKFMKTIEVNVGGSFNVIRLAAASMVAKGLDNSKDNGVFINTASVAAYEGQLGQASYSASKSAVIGMSLPIARELSRYGMRVNTISPGIFETPMMASLPDKVRNSLTEQVPFPPRFGTADEYAHLAQAIIENEMINGEVIRLDGALRMGAK